MGIMKDRLIIIAALLCFLCFQQVVAQEKQIQENGKTYLLHVVQKGETIFSLSQTYSIDRKELLNANPDLIFGLKAGQELKIPVNQQQTKQAQAPAQQEPLPNFSIYKVKRKDALHFIAKEHGVTVDDILKYNPILKKEGLKKDQELRIPDTADLKRINAQKTENAGTEKPKTHRVVGDETLYSISKKYNCTIASLLEANPEAKNGLRIGMELTIPVEKEKQQPAGGAGEGFFTHVVESGETFWSLERKYHVSQEELEKYNPALSEGLKAGLQIKVPVSEALPDIQVEAVDDRDFNKHQVVKGETLYSLANQYQVKVSELKKANPVLNYRGLLTGETILIPKEKSPLVEPVTVPLTEETASEVKQEEPVAKNPVRVVAWERPAHCQPDPSAARQKYDVALLLPLYLQANDSINRIRLNRDDLLNDSLFMAGVADPNNLPFDTIVSRKDPLVYPRSENFIHFYEGVLLALDSLKRAGMNVELHVFDTNQQQAVINKLVHLDVFREIDLIIGPVYPELQAPVASFAAKNRIPMVSPLSSAGNFEESNPWYFKVNPTKEYLLNETAGFIGEEYFNQNMVVLQMGNYRHLPEAKLVELSREKFLAAGYGDAAKDIRFHEYNFSAGGASGLSNILSKTRQNIIIIPSDTEAQVSVAMSNLNSLSEKYPITLVGLSNFQRYRSIQPEYFHHVNMQLLSPYFTDYRSRLTNSFIRKFRDNFAAEPNQFSFQGYDVAFYFMSALFEHGKDFVDCLPFHRVPLIQAEFAFEKVSRYGGYMNHGLFIIKHKPDYEVVVDGLRGVPSVLLSGQ